MLLMIFDNVEALLDDFCMTFDNDWMIFTEIATTTIVKIKSRGNRCLIDPWILVGTYGYHGISLDIPMKKGRFPIENWEIRQNVDLGSKGSGGSCLLDK